MQRAEKLCETLHMLLWFPAFRKLDSYIFSCNAFRNVSIPQLSLTCPLELWHCLLHFCRWLTVYPRGWLHTWSDETYRAHRTCAMWYVYERIYEIHSPRGRWQLSLCSSPFHATRWFLISSFRLSAQTLVFWLSWVPWDQVALLRERRCSSDKKNPTRMQM